MSRKLKQRCLLCSWRSESLKWAWTRLVSHALKSISFISNGQESCTWVHAKSFQYCPILSDPMNCSPPGSFVHGILQARMLEGFTHALLQEIFPTQGSNPCLYISCIGRWALYHWHHLGSPSGKLPKLKDASERAGEPTELGMIKLHFKQLCTSRFQPEESSYWYFGGLLGILVAQW